MKQHVLAQLLHDVVNGMQACYLMPCLFCLLAKPIHNLALRVFQRYSDELCQGLSSCPEEVTAVLYSNELVTRQERKRIEEDQRVTKFEKATILLQAIEKRIVAENSSVPLKKFCQLLRRHHGVGSIVSRMKFQLGEWMR